MDKSQVKHQKRTARHRRIRARVTGTAERPRLAVFRSNRYMYAQLIDDTTNTTLAAADSRTLSGANATERATALGSTIAEKANAAGITTIVFDRGGYQYHGAVAALAEAARAGGLAF